MKSGPESHLPAAAACLPAAGAPLGVEAVSQQAAVYSPKAAVLYEWRAGFCAGARGIALALTEAYPGQTAMQEMMKRYVRAGLENDDTAWFAPDTRVAGKTRRRRCAARRDAANRDPFATTSPFVEVAR